jgi:hypothetical protein
VYSTFDPFKGFPFKNGRTAGILPAASGVIKDDAFSTRTSMTSPKPPFAGLTLATTAVCAKPLVTQSCANVNAMHTDRGRAMEKDRKFIFTLVAQQILDQNAGVRKGKVNKFRRASNQLNI